MRRIGCRTFFSLEVNFQTEYAMRARLDLGEAKNYAMRLPYFSRLLEHAGNPWTIGIWSGFDCGKGTIIFRSTFGLTGTSSSGTTQVRSRGAASRSIKPRGAGLKRMTPRGSA